MNTEFKSEVLNGGMVILNVGQIFYDEFIIRISFQSVDI